MSIKRILLESEEYKDIIITVPKSVDWEDYKKELKKAEQGEELNFKVSNFPKTKEGNKCYVVHDGQVKGYMIISGLEEKEFTCSTTGKEWKGKFVKRTGKFHPVEEPKPMKGFQGYRYYEH